MITKKGAPRSLKEIIQFDEFYSLDETSLLHLLKTTFASELERLKNAKVAESTSPTQKPVDSKRDFRFPSEILYNQRYGEIDRTLTGVLALRWIINDDYERFICNQSPRVRLQRQTFDWIRDRFLTNLQSHEDIFALVLSMIINDIGKDPDLEQDYFHATNHRIDDQNHDGILFDAAKAGLIPCLKLLDQDHLDDVMLGLELGSELNAGQLAQAENVPISLEILQQLQGNEHAYEMKFLEQILDVAGAGGYIDSRGAKTLIEPVAQGFKTAYEVSGEIMAGRSTLRQGYDQVLSKRGNLLYSKGFRRLTISDPEHRALLRLLTMGRTADAEQAELFAESFYALDDKHKNLLIDGLNIDGNENETAVLPYYMPAMLSETLNTMQGSAEEAKQRAVSSLMRYLARVLATENTYDSTTPISTNHNPTFSCGIFTDDKDGSGSSFSSSSQRPSPPVPGIVVERNMMKAREVISSSSFRTNPEALDKLDIPKGQVLQRRRTSIQSPTTNLKKRGTSDSAPL